MSITIKFLILYLIPIISILGTFGLYLLAYGTNPKNIVDFVFLFMILGFIVSCYITVQLISQFWDNKIIYSGIVFSILGFFLEVMALLFYIVMFNEFLNF